MTSAIRTAGFPVGKPKQRLPYWDNARFACIALVVIGHAIQRMTSDSAIAEALYLLIYSFHMPAFAIISGYFSKAKLGGARQLMRVISDLIVPYVIFESIWWVVKYLHEGTVDLNLTTASWTLWFLLALAIFRLVLPYLAVLRFPLITSVIISIGAGYASNLDSTFSILRALSFLPFFVLGWWLNERDVVARYRLLDANPWRVRVAAVGILAIGFLVAWLGYDLLQSLEVRGWLFYDETYRAIFDAQMMWWAGAIRLGVLALGFVMSMAFLSLVPRGRFALTFIGQHTMYVYLLHTFVLYPFRETRVLTDAEPNWVWVPVVIVLSLGLTILLASAPVRACFRFIVEPGTSWLFRRDLVTAEKT